MKFEVKRASHSWPLTDKPPCEGAVKDGEEWFIEIPTLEDLMAFEDLHGSIVISKSVDMMLGRNDVRSILIYDNYIE